MINTNIDLEAELRKFLLFLKASALEKYDHIEIGDYAFLRIPKEELK